MSSFEAVEECVYCEAEEPPGSTIYQLTSSLNRANYPVDPSSSCNPTRSFPTR